MSKEQDKIFFKNYSIILALLAVMILIFLIAAQIVGTKEEVYVEQRAEQVSERTQPIGQIAVTGEAEEMVITAANDPTVVAAAEETPEDAGKRVYSGLCFSCHGTGLPGIPQLGDATVWAERVANGTELLYERALNGFTGSSGMPMPAKGGNPSLSDDEVKAAVDYMIANSQ